VTPIAAMEEFTVVFWNYTGRLYVPALLSPAETDCGLARLEAHE
jgi:hypothetical protein